MRLEMKYCLYGNDITTETTPLEARLGWVTKLEKDCAFIGQEALSAQKEQGVTRVLVGFELRDRGIARHGCDVVVEGTWRKLRQGVFSNGVREGQSAVGDRMLAIVRD